MTFPNVSVIQNSGGTFQIECGETNAWLSMELMFHLSVLPLTLQLTNISGNLWGKILWLVSKLSRTSENTSLGHPLEDLAFRIRRWTSSPSLGLFGLVLHFYF